MVFNTGTVCWSTHFSSEPLQPWSAGQMPPGVEGRFGICDRQEQTRTYDRRDFSVAWCRTNQAESSPMALRPVTIFSR
jgi:hypothetical protein